MSISRMSRGGARRPSCFIRDTNEQALAYAYFEDEPGRRAAAHLPTRDEARRIAANIATLSELLRRLASTEPDCAGTMPFPEPWGSNEKAC
jgi:hypothetical protein